MPGEVRARTATAARPLCPRCRSQPIPSRQFDEDNLSTFGAITVREFGRFWRWLRPPGLDPAALRRADRVLGFSLALMGFCPLFVGIFLFCRAPLSALVVGMAWATLLLNLLALRRSGAVRGSALTVAVTAWLTYTSLAFLQGGHDSPGLMWYATLPIISVALLGPRAGWWGWLLGAAIVTGFYLASLNRIAIPCELSDAGLLFVEYTGLLGLMLCTLALTATFNAMEAAAQRRIGEALDQAMVADRTKSEFLANMSHEIRTPLNAMLGFAELLLEGAVEPDETPDALRTIKRNGEHLLTIISDILDLSKIESGQMTLEPLPCDPVGVIRDVLQLVRSRAEPKGLTLTLRTEGVVPRQIVTDPTRLKQILLNLVGNAIKFTERGGVTVALRGADGRLQISVIDTGIGLTEDQQNRLFKAFSQGDTSTTRRFGGTGLGLVISRRLAEMLGGDIAVQSDVGSGATFTISMPNTVVVEPEAASLANNSTAASRYALPVLSGRRILIADDMPDNRRLISFLLAKTGAECVAVDDGATAIAAVMMAVIDGRPFDLILMDMQMPVLDGYAATQQLRAEGCRLPIVALTANSMSTDRERCLAAGCDDYLSKPIQREQMYGLIARWIATPAEASVTVS